MFKLIYKVIDSSIYEQLKIPTLINYYNNIVRNYILESYTRVYLILQLIHF